MRYPKLESSMKTDAYCFMRLESSSHQMGFTNNNYSTHNNSTFVT